MLTPWGSKQPKSSINGSSSDGYGVKSTRRTVQAPKSRCTNPAFVANRQRLLPEKKPPWHKLIWKSRCPSARLLLVAAVSTSTRFARQQKGPDAEPPVRCRALSFRPRPRTKNPESDIQAQRPKTQAQNPTDEPNVQRPHFGWCEFTAIHKYLNCQTFPKVPKLEKRGPDDQQSHVGKRAGRV